MKLKSLFAAPLACLLLTGALSNVAQASPVLGQGTWASTLQGRDIDRNAVSAASASAVYLYDTVLGITWLRDANKPSVELSWANANQWADALVTGSGATEINDWRLPGMTTLNVSNCEFDFLGTNCGYNVGSASSEMAHLFHVALGNISRYDALGDERLSGAGLTNTGSFINLQAGGYWLANQLDADTAWRFDTFDGVQDATFKQLPFFAMAVRSGDVMAVPEPATWQLILGAAMVGLGLNLWRRQRASKSARNSSKE